MIVFNLIPKILFDADRRSKYDVELIEIEVSVCPSLLPFVMMMMCCTPTETARTKKLLDFDASMAFIIFSQ